jgi:hypothetical protein
MKTHTIDNYLDLIQNLLDCPQGQEGRLLQQSEELINPELLQVMERAIEELANDGNLESANYLRYWQTQLARLLQQTTTVSPLESNGKTRAYLELIGALLHCPKGSESELLAVNEDLIDSGLVEMMRQMATIERSDRETASYLNNLATEIEQNWIKVNVLESKPNINEKLPNLEAERLVSSQDPWIQENKERQIITNEKRASEESSEKLFESDRDLTTSSQSNSNERTIEERLVAIEQSLARLEDMIVARLQPADPLWYMDVLERASASGWTLSTEEVEKLIGVKPKCEPGKNSYQRGCWLFVKASKMGAQTGWHILKQN